MGFGNLISQLTLQNPEGNRAAEPAQGVHDNNCNLNQHSNQISSKLVNLDSFSMIPGE